jgi:hypothetical protein
MKTAMTPLVVDALRRVVHARFFETERGFQGAFQANLRDVLPKDQFADAIVEEEYQKKFGLHGLTRRPDVIVHIPAADGGDRRRGNFAVFALKLEAGPAAAEEDFAVLDEIVGALDYPFAAFINVASQSTHAERYRGQFHDRIHFFAVWRAEEVTRVKHSHHEVGRLLEETWGRPARA